MKVGVEGVDSYFTKLQHLLPYTQNGIVKQVLDLDFKLKARFRINILHVPFQVSYISAPQFSNFNESIELYNL